MPTPICYNCLRTMRCMKNGLYVQDESPFVWSADVYRCLGCQATMITSFSGDRIKVSELTWRKAVKVDAPTEVTGEAKPAAWLSKHPGDYHVIERLKDGKLFRFSKDATLPDGYKWRVQSPGTLHSQFWALPRIVSQETKAMREGTDMHNAIAAGVPLEHRPMGVQQAEGNTPHDNVVSPPNDSPEWVCPDGLD